MPDTETTEFAVGDSPVRALVIVGTAKPPKDGRFTVVTEGRTYSRHEDGGVDVTVTTSGYTVGADVYLQSEPTTRFPAKVNVIRLDLDLDQTAFGGFASKVGQIRVGPAHPAFAAANLAWQAGATEIEITGLSDEEKAKLRPWFDELPNHPTDPAPVVVSLS